MLTQWARGRGAGDEGTEELGLRVGRSSVTLGFLPEWGWRVTAESWGEEQHDLP